MHSQTENLSREDKNAVEAINEVFPNLDREIDSGYGHRKEIQKVVA